MTRATKSAVIVRAGRNSTHCTWLQGATPHFDLFVVSYEKLPSELLSGAKETVLLPGGKVAGWSAFFAARPDILETYEQIAMIDDDIICSADAINRCFAIGQAHGLSLWQPSLTWNSHFSYAVCLHNPLYQLRFVNFVEMMCPFFAADHLKTCLPILAMGLETGIDRLWCRVKIDPKNAYAIIDAVQVEHSRLVGLRRADQGFTTSYQKVHDEMESKLEIFFRGPVAYAGITKANRKISGRWSMTWRAATTIAAIRNSPNRKSGWFYKPITDHVRHNLSRPIANEPAVIPGVKPR